MKRWRLGKTERVLDTVATEEPLSIRVRHWRKNAAVTESLAVTMRTPSADQELAIGLLLTEGIIRSKADIVEARSLGIAPSNEVLVELAQGVDFDAWRQQRNGFVSASCGICGKTSADQIQQAIPRIASAGWRVEAQFIQGLPKLLQEQQATFNETGGVHAAAMVSLEGKLECLFEDIGRHNALDKVIGYCVINNQLPLTDCVLFISSRSSFELIQKSAMAGAQVLASVGGPSSLAVEAARQFGLTLVCFVRDQRFNVYSGEWRLNL